MNTTNARARKVARQMASGARKVALREDVGCAEAGKLVCLAEAITSLATAVELLVDVSEKQDGDLDKVFAQIGAIRRGRLSRPRARS